MVEMQKTIREKTDSIGKRKYVVENIREVAIDQI